ncbi:ABC transporter permease [Gordonia metallireducens]|uniref:ABC transporter permease n=1 Tax=Gordonia metallireducens TaxID=2897779 RepID=UPI001E3FEE97|nr:ABC transporter permease subunit [Gordonia metallireducens]
MTAVAPVIRRRSNLGGGYSTGLRVLGVVGPVGIVVLILGAWELWVEAAGIKPFILPAPTAIWEAFAERPAFFVDLGLHTLREALAGLALGSLAGAFSAVAAFRLRVLGQIAEVGSAALLALPMVALVPISNVFFGLTPASRIFVVSVAVYPIVLSFLLRGLRDTDPGLVEVFRSMSISPIQTIRDLYVPSMLPACMSALRVGLPTAFSIAIVAEFFGGELNTLGTFIKSSAVQSRVADTWGAALVAFIFAVVLYFGISLLERRVLRWHPSRTA